MIARVGLAWMPAGLWSLVGLRVRAAGRDAAERLRTPSGALAGVATLLFFAVWLVPRLLLPDLRMVDSSWLAQVGPLGLLLVWFGQIAVRGGGEVLGFQAAEADQLFGGPFSPSELLRYKVTLLVVAWVLGGLMLSPMAAFYARHPLGGPAATLLVLPFLQMSAMLATLLRRGGRRRTWWRAAYGAVLVVLGLAALRVRAWGADAWIDALQAHPVAGALLLPFRAGIGLLVADQGGEVLQWAAVMLATDALLVVLLVRAGRGAWLELAAEGAQHVQAALQQVRRGGGVGTLGEVWTVGVPMLPRWRGLGTVAWRRLVEIVRRPATFVTLGGVVALVVVIGVLFPSAVGGMSRTATARGMMASAVAWGTVLVPGVLRLDFRADLDRLDPLLALPIRPSALFLGQILPMVVLVTGLCWTIFAGAALWAPGAAPLALVLGLAEPGFALAVLAVENALFLFFPVRMEGGEAALQSVGRNLAVTFGGWTIHGGLVVMAATTGGLGWLVTSSALVAGLAALLPLLGGAVLAVALGAARLARLDPSADVPR